MSDPAHSTPFLTIGGFTPPKLTTGTVRQPAFGIMSGETSGTGKAPTGKPYIPEEEHQDIKPKTEDNTLKHTGTGGDPPPSPEAMTVIPKPNEKDDEKEMKTGVLRTPQDQKRKREKRERNDPSQN